MDRKEHNLEWFFYENPPICWTHFQWKNESAQCGIQHICVDRTRCIIFKAANVADVIASSHFKYWQKFLIKSNANIHFSHSIAQLGSGRVRKQQQQQLFSDTLFLWAMLACDKNNNNNCGSITSLNIYGFAGTWTRYFCLFHKALSYGRNPISKKQIKQSTRTRTRTYKNRKSVHRVRNWMLQTHNKKSWNFRSMHPWWNIKSFLCFSHGRKGERES